MSELEHFRHEISEKFHHIKEVLSEDMKKLGAEIRKEIYEEWYVSCEERGISTTASSDIYSFSLSVGIPLPYFKEIQMSNQQATIRIDETLPLSLGGFKDVNGHDVAGVANVPAWTVSDTTLATVSASADGLTATLQPLGPLGTVTVSASVNGNTAAAPLRVIAAVDVVLIAGLVVAATISAGAVDAAPSAADLAAAGDTPAAPAADAAAVPAAVDAAPVDAPAAAV